MIVPMYFVCERAREDVKVALVGQGPDELFGGGDILESGMTT